MRLLRFEYKKVVCHAHSCHALIPVNSCLFCMGYFVNVILYETVSRPVYSGAKNRWMKLRVFLFARLCIHEHLHAGFCFGARIIYTTKLVKMARPRPLVFCGPSGSGKSTLIKKMMEEFTDCFGFSISHTTRKPRPGEVNGKDYHFVSRDEMEAAVKNGEFIESAQFSANLYGTSKKAVEDVLKTGKICVLDIDVQGVKSMKNTDLNPKYIFVKPPDMKALEQRLRNRGTETEESLEKRLTTARSEMEYANTPGNFDVVIVNDVVDVAYSELKDAIKDDVAAVKKRND